MSKIASQVPYRVRLKVAGTLETEVHGVHCSRSLQRGDSTMTVFTSRTLRFLFSKKWVSEKVVARWNNFLNLALT